MFPLWLALAAGGGEYASLPLLPPRHGGGVVSTDSGFSRITEEQDMTCAGCNTPLPAGERHYLVEGNKRAEEHLCDNCASIDMDAREAYFENEAKRSDDDWHNGGYPA